MPVTGISNLVSGFVQKVAGASSQPNTIAASAQEATESKTTTLKEAQAGDPAARLKLKREKAAQAQQQAVQTGAAEPGKGGQVDKVA